MVKAEGYKKSEIDFAKKEAAVTYNPAKTTPDNLASAVRKATGFKVTVKER